MNRKILTVILLVLAALTAVGSVTFLGPCVHADGSEAPCAAAGRAVLADGIVLAVLALLLLVVKAPKARTALFILAAFTALVGILLPGTLFPICKMDTMHCRMVMRPAMIILFAVSLLVSVCGLAADKAGRRKGRK